MTVEFAFDKLLKSILILFLICNRLSPIGESGRNSPKDITQIIIRQPSTSTKRSSYDSDRIANNIEKRRSWLAASPLGGSSSKDGGSVVTGCLLLKYTFVSKWWRTPLFTGPTASGRRGRFIVLGSSGECLPVNRIASKRQLFAKSSTNRTADSNSTYSSCNSSDQDHEDAAEEKYYSAKTSFDDFMEGKLTSKKCPLSVIKMFDSCCSLEWPRIWKVCEFWNGKAR